MIKLYLISCPSSVRDVFVRIGNRVGARLLAGQLTIGLLLLSSPAKTYAQAALATRPTFTVTAGRSGKMNISVDLAQDLRLTPVTRGSRTTPQNLFTVFTLASEASAFQKTSIDSWRHTFGILTSVPRRRGFTVYASSHVQGEIRRSTPVYTLRYYGFEPNTEYVFHIQLETGSISPGTLYTYTVWSSLVQPWEDTDVDNDDDGLIEIWNLTQLHHVRNDLDGSHYNDGDSENAATPTNSGCKPVGDSNTPTCHGYELMANLDFADKNATGYNADWDPVVQKAKAESQRGAGFPPIGSPSTPFTGTFEGNNRTIANLFVDVETDATNEAWALAGLFGAATGTLKNLGLTGEHMSVSAHAKHARSRAYAGGLVGGDASASVRVTNCYATGNVSSTADGSNAAHGTAYAGGLIGGTYNGSTLTNCYATGDVSAESRSRDVRAGGLVGGTLSSNTMTGCHATGDVTGAAGGKVYIGGLVGEVWNTSTVRNCYATGNAITSQCESSSYAGGLVGSIKSRSTVSNCYATGGVVAITLSFVATNAYAGGLIGRIENRGSVSDCYAMGDVEAEATSVFASAIAGGLIGDAPSAGRIPSATISNGYSMGNVTAKGSVARKAFAGGVSGKEGGVTACYYSGVVKKGQSDLIDNAQVIQTGPYKTEAKLKALVAGAVDSNAPNKSGWDAKDWDFGTSQALPKLRSYKVDGEGARVQGDVLPGQERLNAPGAPTFEQKTGFPKHNAQAYEATFSTGTLYYFHKEGSYDDSVIASNIKDANNSLSGAGDLTLSNLAASTTYTLYAIVEHNGAQSGVAHVTFSTIAVPLPTLSLATADIASTETTVTITPRGSIPAGNPIFVAMIYQKSDQSALDRDMEMTERVESDREKLGRYGIETVGSKGVWAQSWNNRVRGPSFAFRDKGGKRSETTPLSGNDTFTFTGLPANTEYVIRYQLFYLRSSRGTGVAGNRKEYEGIWTLPEQPAAAEVAGKTQNSVSFQATGSVSGTHRIYYASVGETTDNTAATGFDDATGYFPKKAHISRAVAAANFSTQNILVDGLEANTQYYFYTINYNEVSGLRSSLRSLGRHRTSATTPPGSPDPPRDEPAPDAPRLEAKEGALTRNAQTYVATLGDGTLYYLLQPGEYNSQVTAANVRTTGTSGGAESPKDIVLGPLQAGEEYTLYAIVEHNNVQSPVASQTFTTLAAPVQPPVDGAAPDAPTLTVKLRALTQNSQTYMAAFSAGMLYYLHKEGSYDDSVTATNIKAANKSLAATGDVALSGLTASTTYTLYAFVEHNGAQSPVASKTFTTLAAEDESAVPKPLYTVNSEGVTATTLPLTKKDGVSDASQELNRLFGVKKDTAPSSEELENFGDDPDIGRNNPFDYVFQVNTAGDVVIGNEKGAGSQPLSGNQTNAPLTPNTKYFVYVLDWKGGDNTGISEAHHVTAPDGAWTLPAEVEIAEPSGDRLTSEAAITESVKVVSDTDLHWVLLKEKEVSTDDLTGELIKNATKGDDIVEGRAVVNEGTLKTRGVIALHTGATDFSAGDYVLYYVVEGTTSEKFTAVMGVRFTVPGGTATLSTSPKGRSNVIAYPNPTSGLLHVPIAGGTAEVYSSDGAYVGTFDASEGLLDLSDLPESVYVLRLADGQAFRVVKQ